MIKDLLTWSDVYSLDIAEIDAQHKKMAGIINKLYHAMQSSTEKAEMKAVLLELTEWADHHFATEEKYFEEFNYEDKVEHTKSHEECRKTIEKFINDYFNGNASLPFEMMDYLGEWWTGHILGMDRKYVECFHEHGLK